ncbi:hypothetical protein BOTBODRAFT_30811 [Botryobasidium botryosum FD-172 SS1]|uniref:MFS general substrate transporter n=1 Tax=Botryobasidium botryosum (strain FD-172 SS1) TaxID=930990 RepID=A0A067MX71_BOTB1|nr:hypothetical protein BOTBODRAFT_30811 [Botryobasidium botryosum FD-172 SS1]
MISHLDVPALRRFAQVALAVIFCLLTAGIVFGYAALKPILIRQGVYADLCPEFDPDKDVYTCDVQDLRLNFMFTLSAVVTNLCALPVGFMLDKIGPQWTSILGGVTFGLGHLFFGIQSVQPFLDTYYIGFVLIAAGGPLIFFPTLHLSNAFPRHSSLIMSCVTGAFGASSIPWYLYQLADNRFGPIPIRTFFWGYMVIPVLLIVEQFLIGPPASYSLNLRHHHSSIHPTQPGARHGHPLPDTEHTTSQGAPATRNVAPPSYGTFFDRLSDDEESRSSQGVVPEHLGIDARAMGTKTSGAAHESQGEVAGERSRDDSILGVLHGFDIRVQLRSEWFWVLLVFLSINTARINYYISTVQSQLSFYLDGDEDKAMKLAMRFSLLLPAGGLLGVPIIALLLHVCGLTATGFVLLVTGVAYSVLGLIPLVSTQIAAICVFVIFRPLMYTFVNDYCAKVFGFETFGRVMGLANSLAGLFVLILGPIDLLVKGPLEGDYTPANVTMMVVGMGSAAWLCWRMCEGGQRGLATGWVIGGGVPSAEEMERERQREILRAQRRGVVGWR